MKTILPALLAFVLRSFFPHTAAARARRRCLKLNHRAILLMLVALLNAGHISTASAGTNIIWVSDLLTNATTGQLPDQGFVDLLVLNGYSVTRYNPPDAGAIPTNDVALLNAADLVILGRSIASTAFDTSVETGPWNTNITRPILCINSYLSRSNRLGWFTGANNPDALTSVLNFGNPANPMTSYLIGNLALTNGTTTNAIFQQIALPGGGIDRGMSVNTDAPVPGGVSLATTLTPSNGQFIVSWPAGTALTGVSTGQMLAGYRLQFLAGNREAANAPENTTASSGFNNLTPTGEAIFLRAVRLAIPTLSITRIGATQVQVTWPALGGTNRLYFKSDLNSSSWTLEPEVDVPSGGQHRVTVNTTAAKRFWTLRSSASQPMSANAVGYVNLTLGNKLNLVCNPLNGTNNSIQTVMPAAPDNTILYRWNPASQRFRSADTYFALPEPDGGWRDTGFAKSTTVLNPGEGFFLSNPSANATLTFIGEVPQGNLTNAIRANYGFISSIVPQSVPIESVGFPGVSDEQYVDFNANSQSYTAALTYFNVGDPQVNGFYDGFLNRVFPTPNVGQGFVIFNPGPALSWGRSYNATQ